MSKLDIGTVKSLKIDVLTETGWFEDARFKQNMADYGGAEQTQYRIAWDAENAGGYAALLTVTSLDGDERKILLDTGWNNDWMDYVFARHHVDRMLERGARSISWCSRIGTLITSGASSRRSSTTRSSKFTPRLHGARKTGSC